MNARRHCFTALVSACAVAMFRPSGIRRSTRGGDRPDLVAGIALSLPRYMNKHASYDPGESPRHLALIFTFQNLIAVNESRESRLIHRRQVETAARKLITVYFGGIIRLTCSFVTRGDACRSECETSLHRGFCKCLCRGIVLSKRYPSLNTGRRPNRPCCRYCTFASRVCV